MSETEKRINDYMLAVANNEYTEEPNWAFLAIMLNLIDLTDKKEN